MSSALLALDTSREALAFALKRGDQVEQKIIFTGQEQAALLLPALLDFLKSCTCSLESISAFAVNTGPGSFTGLRIGISAARGIAYSLKRPVIGTSAFAALWHSVPPAQKKARMLLLLASLRAEPYAQYWTADGTPSGDAFCLTQEPEDDSPILMNDPALTQNLSLAAQNRAILFTAPTVKAVAELAAIALERASLESAELIKPEPFYVREADVTLPSGAKASARPMPQERGCTNRGKGQ